MFIALAEQQALSVETAQTTQAGAETAQHAAEQGIPELPNLLGVIHHILAVKYPAAADALDNMAQALHFNDPMGTPFTAVENIFFALLVIVCLSAFFISGYLRLKRSPKEGRLSRRSLLAEIVVVYFDDFFGEIMGRSEVRRHLPFVGTLFIYILCMNMLGLVFLGKAPTANLSFNLGMALMVFLYVHYTGISRSPFGYLKHYPGELPTVKELGLGPVGILLIGFMAILFTVIHVLEAIIQPVSLSLRLFGNMLGKDVLLGVFGTLMLIPLSYFSFYFPWQTPFLFLGLLLGAIQALIFSLLTAVYIMLWLPHTKHHDDENHEATSA